MLRMKNKMLKERPSAFYFVGNFNSIEAPDH
jgi:hypothetical protein